MKLFNYFDLNLLLLFLTFPKIILSEYCKYRTSIDGEVLNANQTFLEGITNVEEQKQKCFSISTSDNICCYNQNSKSCEIKQNNSTNGNSTGQTEQITDQNTEQITDQNTEQITDRNTEQITDQNTELNNLNSNNINILRNMEGDVLACPGISGIHNNCGIVGIYEPVSPESCTKMLLVQGYCCFVKTDNGNACIRTKELNKKEKNSTTIYIDNYIKKINQNAKILSVECNGNNLKYYLLLIIFSIIVLC